MLDLLEETEASRYEASSGQTNEQMFLPEFLTSKEYWKDYTNAPGKQMAVRPFRTNGSQLIIIPYNNLEKKWVACKQAGKSRIKYVKDARRAAFILLVDPNNLKI